jgi:hypothetical protein
MNGEGILNIVFITFSKKIITAVQKSALVGPYKYLTETFYYTLCRKLIPSSVEQFLTTWLLAKVSRSICNTSSKELHKLSKKIFA